VTAPAVRAPDCPVDRVVYGDRPCQGPGTYYCDPGQCEPVFERRFHGEESPAEKLARSFHQAYERLAPQYGYTTRHASRVPWDRVPERNRRLMVAVAQELLDAGEAP
jgi:hypothetical protein